MNILDLLQEKGIVPKHVGKNKGFDEYKSACPACGGEKRFVCHPERGNHGDGTYWCRDCGAKGDIIQFMVDYCSLDYAEAFRAAGREMPSDYVRQPKWKKPDAVNVVQKLSPGVFGFDPEVNVPLWREHVSKFVEWAHTHLLSNPGQLQFLANRGISRQAVIKHRIGFNPGEDKKAIYRPRESWGLPTILKDDGSPKRLWIPRGIVIPWFIKGELRRVKIRRMDEDISENMKLRYYAMPGSDMTPMLINPDRKVFAVVESELDGFMLDDIAGDLIGIMALGTVSASPDIVGSQTLTESICILNALDNDEAGARARDKWRNTYPQSIRHPAPVGSKDPGEAYQAGHDIRAWIQSGLPPVMTLRTSALDQVTQGERVVSNSGLVAPDLANGVGKKDSAVECLPESVQRLHGLMVRFPVKIICNEKRLTFQAYGGWRNVEAKMEISKLVFQDRECFDYLHDHPAGVITRENFYGERQCGN